MVSKACVVGMYQRKLEELAGFPDLELHVVVPPYWRDGRRIQRLERSYTKGYRLQVLPMVLNGHFHVHFYPGLGKLMRAVQPDIVHLDEEPHNLVTWQGMRLAEQVGAKALFFTWQNLNRRYPFPFSAFEGYNLRRALQAIAGNQEAEAVLRAKGYKGHIHHLPQFGVDPDLYRAQRETRVEPNLAIGFMGRLVEEKGAHILLRAAAAVDAQWTIRVIGTGPYQAHLERLSKELDIADRVQFEAWKPSAAMPSELNRLDVLVLPSLTRRNWKEQFGRVLIEAMACEVPVVGSSSGEIPHLIGDAGLVFPEGDFMALRGLLTRLQRDPGLRQDLGQRGRKRVLQHYTQHRIAEQTYMIYKEMLAA